MNAVITKSASIKNIAEALSKLQAVVENAKKDSENPYYNSKYADLESVLAVARKPMSENGLSITQFPEGADGSIGVSTILMHVSGEWIQSAVFVQMEKDTNPQIAGKIITYLRRYTVESVLGIAREGEDDDGESARKLTETKKSSGSSLSQRDKEGKTEGTGTPAKATEKDTSAMIRLIHVLMRKGGLESDKEKHEYAEILLMKDVGAITSFKELSWDDCKTLIDKLQKK